MQRCIERVWVSRGGHLSSKVCADSITGEKTERTNERPALSKDKGGNSPRQIIEWPDSASLFLSSSPSLFPFHFAPIPASPESFVPLFCALESTRFIGFSHTSEKRKSWLTSMDDVSITTISQMQLFFFDANWSLWSYYDMMFP